MVELPEDCIFNKIIHFLCILKRGRVRQGLILGALSLACILVTCLIQGREAEYKLRRKADFLFDKCT